MNCPNCGASNSAEQARIGNCAYCGAALPHAVRAIEQEAVLKRLLEDRDGDGIPDGIQALALLEGEKRRHEEQQAKVEEKAEARRALERELAEATNARVELKDVAFFSLFAAVVVSIFFHLIVVRGLRQDPWLGAHHQVFCPLVCDGCRGPYVIFAWTAYSTPTESSGESTRVYCQPSDGYFASYNHTDFLIGLKSNEKYALPGATYILWLSEIPLVFLAMLPLMYGVFVRHVRARRADVPRLAAQLAAMKRRDGQ